MLPLLVLVLAIGSGARTFAGEEDAGTLELVLSYPIRRRSAVLAKGAALAVEIAALSVATGIAVLLLDPLVGLDLSLANVVGAVASIASLGLVYGWLSLGLGAAFGSRALALGVSAGAAAADYLIDGLHELAGWLDPFRIVSPFWLIGSAPLQGGADWTGIAVVVAAAATFLAGGALLVERRDLQVP